MGAGDPLNRYARQVVLPEVGAEGQASLARARILVVGAGGLGCPALQYLAGAGAGRITIVDPDFVSLENLHRQTLYSMGDLGVSKASAASRILKRLNPCITIHAVAEPLTPSNVSSLLSRSDAALDCADSLAVTYILSDACLGRGIPLISASALGLSGYAGGFLRRCAIRESRFQEPPAQSATCAEAGVLGPGRWHPRLHPGANVPRRAAWASTLASGHADQVRCPDAPVLLVSVRRRTGAGGQRVPIHFRRRDRRRGLRRRSSRPRRSAGACNPVCHPLGRRPLRRRRALAEPGPACGPVLPLGPAVMAGRQPAPGMLARRNRARRTRRRLNSQATGGGNSHHAP